MAEEGTSDTPSITESPSTVLEESPLAGPNETTTEILIGSFTEALAEVAHEVATCTEIEASQEFDPENQVEPTPGHSSNGKDDDDVLFVFSVPRRRRKKRKRAGSAYAGSDAGPIDAKEVSSDLAPRRASTSVFQKSEPCITKEHMPDVTQPGSLSITASDTTELDIRRPTSNTIGTSSSILPKPKPYPSWNSWWGSSTMPLLSKSDAQHNWIPIPIGGNLKRKWGWDHGGRRVCAAQPTHRLPLLVTLPNVESGISDLDAPGEVVSDPNLWSMPIPNTMESSTPGLAHPVATNSPTTNVLTPDATEFHSGGSASNLSEGDRLGPSQPQSTLPQTSAHCQRIQVPASLVPDESVSPRTTTVEIIRKPSPGNPKQSSPPTITQAAGFIPGLSRVPLPMLTSTNSLSEPSDEEDRVEHRRFPTPSSTSVAVSTPQQLTDPHDLLRRPSLYRIPPWPSQTSTPIAKQGRPPLCEERPVINPLVAMIPAGRAPVASLSSMQSSLSTFLADRNRGIPPIGGIASGATVARQVPSSGQAAVLGNNSRDRGGTATAVATPQQSPQQSQPSQLSATFAYPRQGQRSNRPFPPNLIVDIAQTCQENFPFTAVAERHQVPVQKVFDTFSAIIQLPLLRHTDNRRHGDLGKQRIKEFRDAKKAMEKANEERQKKTRRPSRVESLGDDAKPAKKMKKVPGLLKTAVLNNAKEKESGS